MRYLYIIFLCVIFNGCSHRQQKINTSFDKNDSILITYFTGQMETNTAIRCERLATIQYQHPKNDYGYVISEEGAVLEQMPVELIDTFIVNNDIWNRIEELLTKRASAPDFSEDARIYVTLKNRNGDCNYLCIDQLENRVKYNDEACSMDNELFFLLRYYSGYYLWFNNSDLDQFEELRDTTFYQKTITLSRVEKAFSTN